MPAGGGPGGAPPPPVSVRAVAAFLFAVFAYALAAHLQVMDRWMERPYLLVFPIIGAAGAGGLGYSVSTGATGSRSGWSR